MKATAARGMANAASPSFPLDTAQRDSEATLNDPGETRAVHRWTGRRMLMLVQHPGIEGPLPKHTPLLIAALRKAGVIVATAPWGRRREGESLATKAFGRLLDLLSVLRRLRRERFDVLLVKSSHDPGALLRDVPLAVLARPLVPCTVIQFHGGWTNRLVANGHRLFKAASSLLQRASDGMLLLSTEECNDWKRFRPDGRYLLASNPFVATYAPPTFRAECKAADGVPVVLLVGRVIAEKGVLDLVEAIALLKDRSSCRAHIAGNGPLCDAVLARAAALGIADRISMLGYLDVEPLANAYREADVFALPTYWCEGFATVVTEAMSMGLPVITTRIRGMADHLVERENALFVPPRDPAALADAIVELLSDAQLRRRMSFANRDKVAQFAPPNVAGRYLDAVAQIAGWNGDAIPDSGRRGRRLAVRTAKRTVHIADVEAFWSANPCDAHAGHASERRRYFEEIEQARYGVQSYIPTIARFGDFADKTVLEIGCGVGTDGRQFAKAGAIYTGINLDRGSTKLAQESFRLFDLPGTLLQMNAERLEFADASFDHIYSMGVLHHSPSPAAIAAEALRVLKPGGTIAVMVYNRTSINYYVNIMLLRRMLRYLLVPAFAPRLIARFTGLQEQKLARHRALLLEAGMTRERWISVNTDGPDCPLSRVYGAQEAADLLAAAGFRELRSHVRFFDRRHYGFFGALIPGSLARWLGRRAGWHRWVEGVKRDAAPSLDAAASAGFAHAAARASPAAHDARRAVDAFVTWLGGFGDVSQDLYDLWASSAGRRAKSVYYRHPKLGFALVAPLALLDVLAPSARRYFSAPQRFPIADAHYAMGFLALASLTGRCEHADKGRAYLAALQRSRCRGFAEYCWGYPFDWETCFGTFAAGTPLITTVAYVYEAFEAGLDVLGDASCVPVMKSIARFAHGGFRQTQIAPGVTTTSYTPDDARRVVNANAYRAYLLIAAASRFRRDEWRRSAEGNLAFVLSAQRDDGSWLYAHDGRDAFIDNFHTCFVIKNLVKIWRLTGRDDVVRAIHNGYAFYKAQLLDDRGAPRAFARTQRVTLQYHELYDYAEGVNLALLMRELDPDADSILERLVGQLCAQWQAPDGHFVTRRYALRSNRVPYHRWAQSQTFRALVMYIGACNASATARPPSGTS